MRLTHLELEQFRTYERLDLPLHGAGLRLHGANASGKSSLLEAIVMLATTRSPRTGTDRETIRWGSGEAFGVAPFARILGTVQSAAGSDEIEIRLQADNGRGATARKSIRLNGRPVRAADAVGRLKAVLFAPEDVTLASGSPSTRRRYLDLTISQTSGDYLRALSRYARVLEQRNGLLRTLQRERAAPHSAHVDGQLAFWDEELLLHGSVVAAHRLGAIDRLSRLASEEHLRLTDAGELRLGYLPGIAGAGERADAGFAERIAVVRRAFEAGLRERRPDEVRRGVSLVGPHRDDFTFESRGIDVGVFGSRGQQRLAVVALKLAETRLMAETAGEAPVLLLDDVLSELDPAHRALLEQAIAALSGQVIVTATDDRDWRGSGLERLPSAELREGRIVHEATPDGFEDSPVA